VQSSDGLLVTMQAVRESCYVYADVYCSVYCCGDRLLQGRAIIKVCLHDVSLMYTCLESAHGVEGGAPGQRTWHT
jgi:hypothetical protein